jgi:hypothetical protein
MNATCYGWFNHNNVGDELFKDAFTKLFPDYNFTFTDHFTLENVNNADVIFLGGGSFLNQPIFIPEDWMDVWDNLLRKKILYIGVGLETDIHKDHKALLYRSSLVATRTKNKLNNPVFNVIEIPDLVYALNDSLYLSDVANPNSVLILPNVSVVPRHNDPHWMHASWDHFKTEMAQFLDYLIDSKYSVRFANMCLDHKVDDNFASHAICSTMINRESNIILNYLDIRMISTYGMVITQRFHGIVMSDMAGVPCLPIYHHDKLKSENSISYYELSKNKLIENFESVKNKPVVRSSFNLNSFNQLIEEVKNIIEK